MFTLLIIMAISIGSRQQKTGDELLKRRRSAMTRGGRWVRMSYYCQIITYFIHATSAVRRMDNDVAAVDVALCSSLLFPIVSHRQNRMMMMKPLRLHHHQFIFLVVNSERTKNEIGLNLELRLCIKMRKGHQDVMTFKSRIVVLLICIWKYLKLIF